MTPKNMEGAGSLRLANWLYNVAPKDGTAFGTIGRGTGFDPLLGHKAAQFDGTKFNWIGSANDEVSVCVAWNEPQQGHQVRRPLDQGAHRRRHRRGRRHRPVPAHHQRRARHQDEDHHRLSGRQRRQSRDGARRGRRPLRLVVVEREVDPRGSGSSEKKITILMQLSLAKHPDLPDVPLIIDLAKTDEQRQILQADLRAAGDGPALSSRRPACRPDRVAALRKAFMDTMKDKEFLAEADKAQLEITPVSGEAVQKLVTEVYQTPPDDRATRRRAEISWRCKSVAIRAAARRTAAPAAPIGVRRVGSLDGRRPAVTFSASISTHPARASKDRRQAFPWTQRLRTTPAGSPTSSST